MSGPCYQWLSLLYCPCFNLMSISFPTQGHHVVYMCPDIIFQILPPCSKPMTSHHVTCHVTVVSCASSSSKRKIKEKRKENQYKIRKIKEKKNKIVSVQASHNSLELPYWLYTVPKLMRYQNIINFINYNPFKAFTYISISNIFQQIKFYC